MQTIGDSAMRTFAQRPKTTQPTASAKASTVSRAHVGQAHDPNSILNLQRTIGNQAVLRLLQSNAEERNAVLAGTELPHFAHDFARIPVGPPKAGALQTKPAISKPGNEYEREADRVAEQVMRMPERQMQGACPCGGGCPKCQTKQPGKVNELLQTNRVQAREAEGIAAPPLGHRVRPSSGQPLDSATRNFFESRFGQDFAHVRVHTDSKAVESASQLGARAYTVGEDIVFGEGMYRPETHGGQRLLTHELAHVVQQRIVQTPTGEMSASRDTDELQAEMAVATLGWGGLGRYYDAVALDLTWHSDTRPLPSMPVLSPAGALIQRVQLTYDDGPDSAGNTRTVLTALNAAGARATFYLVGKRVAQSDNWRIVFDIAAAGHWLGNHAYDWNDATDNHIFLNGTAEERANKILQTEWAIRDALIQGRDDAKKSKSWDTIPLASRDYIEDVIAHGTGRFRTPGFRSKPWNRDGTTTLAAIASVNSVLAATGLRPLAITELSKWGPDYEGVTVDPEDWRSGRTQSDIESAVKGGLSSNDDSILLHSRLKATAEATPAILSDIKSRKWTFDPTVQGALGSKTPKPPFANLSTISNPPTSAEIGQARAWLRKNMLSFGPFLSGSVAIGIFQMAQQAGSAEVSAFAAEIKATKVRTKDGEIPMANWMNAYPEWRLFATFFENWMTNKPFPRIKGITI